MRPRLSAASLVLVPSLVACVAPPDEGDAAGAPATTASAHQRRVDLAWLGSDPSNRYDGAILDGVRAVAADRRARVTPFYSAFDPAAQLEQCLQVVRAGRHDAIVIIPVDPVGIVPCVRAARARRLPVVAVDLPIGPAFDTAEPQVPGQAGAVLVPAAAWGEALAPLVVERCAGRDPCELVYLAGSFDVAFDQVARARLDQAIAAHPSIRLVATEQAFYDRELARDLTRTILADHPGVDLVIGAGDQMAQGAEEALVEAGVAPGAVELIGAGAGAYGIAAVRAGRWSATFLAVPRDEGELAADLAIRAARCQPIADRGIDPLEALGLPPFFTVDNQDELADFDPQWPG